MLLRQSRAVLARRQTSKLRNNQNLRWFTAASVSSSNSAASAQADHAPASTSEFTLTATGPKRNAPLTSAVAYPASAASTTSRLEHLKNAKPFSAFLTDSFQRQHTYLRISLTERCNLRCTYCMPAEGVPLSPPNTQLTTPEILMIASLFVREGISKIRLTGGEPTVRRDIVPLMESLGDMRRDGLRELCITSNGIALRSKLDALAAAGLTGVNLSLDTLEPGMFEILTRRRGFEKVMATLERILDMNRAGAGIKLKLNVVVMRNVNEAEILRFVELGREKEIEVRFIEYMPFDGNRWARAKVVSYEEILAQIRHKYPSLERVPGTSSDTSKTWQVPGFAGRIGFITSMTENFCSGCNRLRITSDGNLKVCLFGNAEVSLRDILRKDNGGEPIDQEAWEAMRQLEIERLDGTVARHLAQETSTNAHQEGIDQNTCSPKPMDAKCVTSISPGSARSSAELSIWRGSTEREHELLEVIGKAVGRKKAQHAGMGVLENLKNRPMILIADRDVDRSPSFVYHRLLHPEIPVKRPILSPILAGMRITTQPINLSCRMMSTLSGAKDDVRTTDLEPGDSKAQQSLTHLTPTSEIHVVSTSKKCSSYRKATAVASIAFGTSLTLPAVESAALRKGDVLAVARIAGIMAAKRTSDIVPLCHPGIGVEEVRCWVMTVGPTESEASGEREDKHLEGGKLTAACQERSSTETNNLSMSRNSADADSGIDHKLEAFLVKQLGSYGGIRIAATVSCTGKTGVEMEALCAVTGAGLSVIDMVKSVDRAARLDGVRVVRKSGGRSGKWETERW